MGPDQGRELLSWHLPFLPKETVAQLTSAEQKPYWEPITMAKWLAPIRSYFMALKITPWD